MPDAVPGKIVRVGVQTGLIQARFGRCVEEVHFSTDSDNLKCRDLSLKYSVGDSVAFFCSSRQGKFAKVKEAGFVCLVGDLHEGGAKISLVVATHATASTADGQEIYMAANRLSHEFPRGAKQQTSQLDLTIILSVGDRIEFKAAEQVTSVQWRATWVRLVGRVAEHDGPNNMTPPKLPLYGYEHFGIFEASAPTPPQPSHHRQPTAVCQQQLINYADLSNFSSEENIINDEATGVSDFYRPITSSPRVDQRMEKEVPRRETSGCRRRRWDETPEAAQREERKRRRRKGEESDTSRDSRRRKLSRRRDKADAATQTNGEATSTELEQLRIDGSELRRSLLSIGNQQLTDLSVILLKALSSLSPSTTDQQEH